MDEFFRKPILNSPYEYPGRHWKLDKNRQPTNRILDRRRCVSLITPIPAARRQRGQRQLVFDKAAEKLDTDGQQYDPTPVINESEIETQRARLSLLDSLATLDATAEAYALADGLVRTSAVPSAAIRDAVHVAIAAANGVEYLVTWSVRHIANAVEAPHRILLPTSRFRASHNMHSRGTDGGNPQ